MKKGETYRGRVRELAFPNKGIAAVEDIDVIVKNTLPGQEISFILNKNKAGLKEGRLLSVLERSGIETFAGCSVCDSCGGCVYQRIPYEEELALKDKMAVEILGRALKLHDEPAVYSDGDEIKDEFKSRDILDGIYEGITGSPEVSGYRNKMEFSFGNAVKDGPITLGMHTPGHFMDVIDTPDCNIVDADFRLIREYVLSFAKEKKLPFYHRYSNTGYLRNLLVRKGINTGEILVCIVTTSDGELFDEEFAEGLWVLPVSGRLKGVLHTLHDGVADAVINESTSVIYGRDHIYDEILGLRFKISAFSFFQTNTRGAEVLYERVREYVRYAVRFTESAHSRFAGEVKAGPGRVSAGESTEGNAGVVYDLYSGTGTIAQLLSPVAAKVYGVEIVPEAVEAARVNAKLNGIDNAEFLCGDVLKVLDEVLEKPDLIILDPPRDGVNPKALQKILDYGVVNIVYVSCKITSLARDLHLITDKGYRPVRISVIDMFPRTANFETVCLLSKGDVKSQKLRVEFSLEDMDTDGFKQGATYNAIRDWIKAKYGYRVTNLNIAQVKQKHGIIERENYNKPKSPNNKQPGCPEEKVKAIEDAMRHFQMI